MMEKEEMSFMRENHVRILCSVLKVDMVYEAENNESMVARIEELHGIHTLEHAEEIGLGSRTYELITVE